MADDRSQRATRRPRRSAVPKRLVELLVEADRTPDELAEALGLSLGELSEIAQREGIVDTVRVLAQLSDVRAQMLLSRFRAHAAMQLAQIATTEEPTELTRKACVDLLKADLHAFAGDDSPSATGGDAPAPLGEEVLVAILERLGQEAT
jgi:hypothetical protein